MDNPTIERIGEQFKGPDIGLASNDGGSSVTIEHIAIDPATAFGPEPRTVVIDAGEPGEHGRTGDGGGGSFGGEPAGGNGGGDFGDAFERNDDGSVKRNRDGSPRRKRGRRAGSKTGQTSTKGYPDLTGLSSALLTGSAMLAAALSTPEIALDKDEADPWAKAMAEVGKYHVKAIDPESLAWLNLAMITGGIAIPRMILIRQRRKAERAENITKGGSKMPLNTGGLPMPDDVTAATVAAATVAAAAAGVTEQPATFTPQAAPGQDRPLNASDVPFQAPPGVKFAGLE